MVVALTDLPESSFAQAVNDLFTQTWPRISFLLEHSYTDSELLEACADFIAIVQAYLPPTSFTTLQNALLSSFAKNPKHLTKLLYTYADLCLKMAKRDVQVQAQVFESLD